MPLTIEIPDDVVSELGEDALARVKRVHEVIALELYREGCISLRTMGRLAGVGNDYWSADSFRKKNGLAVNTPSANDQDDIDSFLRQ